MKRILAFCLCLMISAIGCDIGFRTDDGVKLEGRVIAARYKVHVRNKTAIAIMDGKKRAVSTWVVSYIDEDGKLGVCDCFTLSGHGILTDSFIQCRDKSELEFN